MKRLVLLLMCLCLTACGAGGSEEVSSDVATEAVAEVTIEEETVAETTVVEETTVAETTTAETTATAETTVAEETTVTEETTTVTTTTAATTTVATTTVATTEVATTVTTTVAETTATTAATATEAVTEAAAEDYTVIELEGRRFSLSFEDNFDGTVLDESKWERCPEWKRQDLNCYWDNDMSYLDGEGNLILEVSYDKTNRYNCGAVRSKGKFEQTYGYFEARCRVNTVAGYWTAFWLMGETVGDITEGGVNGTEIDIMESAYFNEKKINYALHWDGYAENHKSIGQSDYVDIYDGEYHVFSVLWTEEEYIFYVDGEERWRTSAEESGGICEAPLYIKLTTETGSWTMPKGGIKNLPDCMKVDYVRVYAEEKE